MIWPQKQKWSKQFNQLTEDKKMPEGFRAFFILKNNFYELGGVVLAELGS